MRRDRNAAPRAASAPFTVLSQRVHAPVTGVAAPRRRCWPAMEAAQQHEDEVLTRRRARDPPVSGLALAEGSALTPVGPRVRAARRRSRGAGAGSSRARSCTGRSGEAPLRDGDRSVDVYVHKLRVKLEQALPDWRFIHTHLGFGYRFAARAFTCFSQPATSAVTGSSPSPCERCRARHRQRRKESDEDHRPARRWLAAPRSRSASPPAAATTAARAAAAARARAASSSKLGGTINGAGSTFPQPVYQQWAARFKEDQGTTVNYQARRLRRAASRSSPRAPSTSARSDSALKPTKRSRRRRRRATPVHVPTCFGAVTVSYNVAGVEPGPQARRPDDRRHLPRQDQEVERPGDRDAEPGRRRCRAPSITVVHRSDESGTTKGFTDVPRRLHATSGRDGRRRQDRQVADRHRRQGQRRRRRLRQADRRRGRLRRAGLRAAEQLHLRGREEQVRQVRRADARSRPRRPARASTVPADLRFTHDQLAERRRPTRSRRRRSCSSTRTSCKAGMSEDDGQARSKAG